MPLIFLFLMMQAPESHSQSACEAAAKPGSRYQQELKKARAGHEKARARFPSASEAVSKQDALLGVYLEQIQDACRTEKNIGQGLQADVDKAIQENSDCDVDLAVANVYYRHFKEIEIIYNRIRSSHFDLRSLDIAGNEGTRNLLLELERKDRGLFAQVKKDRGDLWESSIQGDKSLRPEMADRRPFFARLSDAISSTEAKLLEHREFLREKAVDHAQRSQACKSQK